MSDITRESTQVFLRDLEKQFHDDRVSAEDGAKIVELSRQKERQQSEFKAREAQEKAKIEMYRRGNIPTSKALVEGMLDIFNSQIKASNKAQAAHFKQLNEIRDLEAKKEGAEQYDKLIGIERERLDYINNMIRQAEAQEDKALLEDYTQKKEEAEAAIELYQSRYKEFTN